MKVAVFASLLLLVATCGAAVTQFTADVTVTNDVKFNGIMMGKIYWTPNKMKIQFDVGYPTLGLCKRRIVQEMHRMRIRHHER